MQDNNGAETMITEEEKIFWRSASKEHIPIYLHKNLGSTVVTALAERIKKYGGNPKATEDEAEVIICRKDGLIFPFLRKKYDHERYKWVENPEWVDRCLRKKKYEHPMKLPLLRSQPNGKSPFTPAEDEHIVQFLAKRIPYKDMKGRSGHNIDLYPWAVKHPWQSWRERYVKNSAIFDDRIEAVVEADPNRPKKGEKGQYRVEYGGPGRSRPQPNGISCHVEEGEGEEIDIDEEIEKRKATSPTPTIETPSAKRRRIELEFAEQRQEEEEEEEEEVETPRPGPSNDVSAPIAQVDVSTAPTHAPSVSQKRSLPPERPVITSIPSASQHSLPGTGRRSNQLTVVPVTSAPRTESSPIIVPTQTATVLENIDPPALRTRSKSRQPSLERPAHPVEQPRITRRRTPTSSQVPPAPPPPTLATQTQDPQLIDFDRLRATQGHKKVTKKPALIPIPETSESSMINLSRRRTESPIRNRQPVEHMAQVKSTVMSDDDDSDNDENDDDDEQFDDFPDLDSDSSDDMSDSMRLFNEGAKAITNKVIMSDIKEEDQTLKAKPGSVLRARKTAYIGPSPHHKPISDESEEGSEEDESQSENEESGSGTQSSSSSSDPVSLDTETSVPAVGTNARKYVVSRTPFTPARGTLAEKRVENHKWNLRQRKVDKGKERAR
ncbi:hypothetical protein Clacol_006105 [Clathrus columnatus]|uniref:DNA-binding protein RAP1 n=1 Tax=Clathrus columnatus TaxID=1419009 RepID=A0AAV5AB49_9AGAM|nr:hypothetical protein Clacol_006105 [Clathrus columnatus]